MDIPGTPLAQMSKKRSQPSPGACLGNIGYLHVPPDSLNNEAMEWQAREITLLTKVSDHKWWARLTDAPKGCPPVMIELEYFYESQEASDAALVVRSHAKRPRR